MPKQWPKASHCVTLVANFSGDAQQLLLPIYAPPRRRILFATCLHVYKSAYRHFAGTADSSASPQVAGIWAENGALEKGVIKKSERRKKACRMRWAAARRFVLLFECFL